MSTKHTSRRQLKRPARAHVVALGLLSVVSSFAIGVRTAGDVETVQRSEAGGIVMPGDMNADGVLTIEDAIGILEIAQGYESATAEQLLADPNGDGQLTVEDAMRVLHDIDTL